MPLTTLTLPPPSTALASPPIYKLSLSSPPDHRLTPELISSFLAHLDDIERDWFQRRDHIRKKEEAEGKKPGMIGLGGAVVIRGEGERFFSNGE